MNSLILSVDMAQYWKVITEVTRSGVLITVYCGSEVFEAYFSSLERIKLEWAELIKSQLRMAMMSDPPKKDMELLENFCAPILKYAEKLEKQITKELELNIGNARIRRMIQ